MDPHAFLREFALARAEQVREVPGGVALTSSTYPQAQDHNALWLWTDPGVAVDRLVAVAATELAGRHPRLEVDHLGLADRLSTGLAALGWEREDDVVMTFTGAPVTADTANVDGVVVLDLDQRADAAEAGWAAERPEWSPEVPWQLGQRIRTAPPVADCTFLAVRDELGTVVARTDVFRRADTVQIEEVFTESAHRGRGYARRLVTAALQRATVPAIFLVADADDWPASCYARLGFEVTSRRVVFTGP